MQWCGALVVSWVFLTSAEANAEYEVAIDFSGLQEPVAGEPTEVLVLGTFHIAQLEEEQFPIENLKLLIERLLDFAPDIIAIESVPGTSCESILQYRSEYPGVWDRYCTDTTPALQSLGLSTSEAYAELSRLLSQEADKKTPDLTRRMTALFYATGNPYSALVQWYSLGPSEKRVSDGVSKRLIEELENLAKSRNENTVLGAYLASQLGHEQVYPIDDHTADAILTRAPDDLYSILSHSVWGKHTSEAGSYHKKALGMLGTPSGVLAAYRYINSPNVQRLTVDADFGMAAAHSETTRQYVAWWQARGLRMAANLIEATGNEPGAKALVIVGSSHKPYFDAYLNQMHDIALVSVMEILKANGSYRQ